MSLNTRSPTIRGSQKLTSLDVTTLETKTIHVGDITISNGIISGIDDPINDKDAANKNYVNETLNINKTLTEINTNYNITYTGANIIGSIGFRTSIVYK